MLNQQQQQLVADCCCRDALYSDDLSFDMVGYTFIMMNNICTACNGVYTKQKLDAKVGFLFVHAVFSLGDC